MMSLWHVTANLICSDDRFSYLIYLRQYKWCLTCEPVFLVTKAIIPTEMTRKNRHRQTIEAEAASSCLLSPEFHSDSQSEMSQVSSLSVQGREIRRCDTCPFSSFCTCQTFGKISFVYSGRSNYRMKRDDCTCLMILGCFLLFDIIKR